ncbi:TIGR04283 family arsenosugar biosynthesis glycosyltransferase [Algoriphagus namhaensis]|uniref:TIGR04283 family arsenosugar biosynthesis glycosyltransferase n=1 Tax=Algoriphagus namhaensis TaxID=915353 RepID=A0ABV8AU31_9BACT
MISSHKTISVIIPILNEEQNLKKLFPYLSSVIDEQNTELIFVDGGSRDGGMGYLENEKANVVLSPKKGRAAQMNFGAKLAKGKILYFLHADTLPHASFESVLIQAFNQGIESGCFRYRFDSDSLLLRINSWFTRFNGLFAGGGDQSLYILKKVFEELNGFDERQCIMEDFELVRRIRKNYLFVVFKEEIRVSARKYSRNSWLKVQFANLLAFVYFRFNVDSKTIKSKYRSILDL